MKMKKNNESEGKAIILREHLDNNVQVVKSWEEMTEKSHLK
ncbi:MAG: hypothetical protein QG635_2286 [Bacteroidota bacterium]|nr:hypothetical protein [Bacteroidota bacterium]